MLATYVEHLNRLWLEEFFEVEPTDEMMFNDPESSIIEPGGQIFFILDHEIPVGTCAIFPLSADEYELSKMAVEPAYRRQGYGNQLMEAALNFAREAGAQRISLITDTELADAIRLYQRYGFQTIPYIQDPRYKRGNVRMELCIN
ncbi:GNAT family N-acetyltransferase [Euhalothece natronophila Z-M001]|uniref:GNAT family N-acetyltransferase n=2 Tax=Euhalothece TaxID=65097 RepID=A0A5B8NIE4_9CHRO|nr:GNAT family N-acetyltransferase [Euhalothece natronophila Z-M001]